MRAYVGVGEFLRVRVPVGTFGRALINELKVMIAITNGIPFIFGQGETTDSTRYTSC